MKNRYKLLVVLGLFLTAPSLCLFAQVGINTSNSAPDASAGLDVNFSNKGLLPPRMTITERNAIVSPAAGLVIYNTDEKALNLYNGVVWNSMTPIPAFVCGLTLRINHVVSGGVAPVNKTVEYITLNGIPGETAKCWITKNLGASQQATVVSDATEASAGWYFQFNRKQGYQYISSRIPTSNWINIVENSDWVTANDPCAIELGIGWRIPTKTEWINVSDMHAVPWITWSEPYASALKLHAAGYLGFANGSLVERGTTGDYWSSTQDDSENGMCLSFNSYNSHVSFNHKPSGFPVRCLRNN